MLVAIENRWTGAVIITGEYENVRAAVLKAIKSRADLSSADLSGADLSRADLSRANLSRANLNGADLSSANLSGANLSGAYLSGANLSGANLNGADLSGANLSSAYLNGANLSRANLNGADLSRAYLSGANLNGANLSSARNVPALAAAQASILPEEGQLVGWKKCQGNIIVKLLVGRNAKRSNATGRKCRAEHVKVLEVFGAEAAISSYDASTVYSVGKIVRCDKWEENRWVECGGGIHFFLTRIEAENY
jgi:Family of unknown function (DUF5758)/Pentapeptide repeats (8 copies)